ncbi:hypothetical protein HU773_007600 [Pseudomonas shahriarae]|uniref:hypothetical protein n=1 Tax=Pseudomonas shahriarae TaxID=2745512 RepID=UPI0016467556|nr:hypothetical protein [Pseudomonas shahriarae]QXH90728.1 hypothetical protein HU773_007600 [Pseudomonas shahriarae]
MTSSEELKDIDRILELSGLTAFEWHPSCISCERTFSSTAVALIKALIDSPHTEVRLKKKGQHVEDLNGGDVFEVSIDLPKGAHCCLARTPNDLLRFYYLHALPEQYAFADPFYKSWDAGRVKQPAIVERLISANSFVMSLEQHRILERDGNSRSYVVHTHNGKTCIPFKSEAGYLESLPLEIQEAIKILAELFNDSIHSREKERIVRNAIAEAMRSCDLEMRLKHLLKHALEIVLVARNNYDLFVASFSFQNDQEKLYEQKREFNVKLNALLSGIQGKLLAIPVSTILATSQLKNVGEQNYILINASIIFSAAFFTLIIVWLILSQLAALMSIKSEIESKEKRFKVELPRIFSEVESIFTALKASCVFNIRVSKVILGLASILFVVTFYVYVLKTPPLHCLLLSMLHATMFGFLWLFDWIREAIPVVWSYFFNSG